MFEMTIADAIKIHDNLISVAGPCLNRNKFVSRLVDDNGNIYKAHIPFVNTHVFDDSQIILGIYGEYDIETLKGRILKGAEINN